MAFILENPKHVDWTKWDIRIANAYQMMLDYEVEGWPVWIDQSDRVSFHVKSRKSRSGAALEKAQFTEQKKAEKAKNYVPSFGKRLYVVPSTTDGGPMPTKRDWLEDQKNNPSKKQVADPEKVAEFREKHLARKRKR